MTQNFPGTPTRDLASRGPRPPCVVIHGDVNALSVARSLGRAGIRVYAINDADSPVCMSRYVIPIVIPVRGRDREEVWAEYLLGPDGAHLFGSVLLACSDPALRMLALHREELARHYLLDLADPDVQLAMLDKRASLEVARDAGVGHPKFWVVKGPGAVDLPSEMSFPALVKPVDTYRFLELTGHKILVVEDRQKLEAAMRVVVDAGLEFVIVELIPGPDDLLCSYYTYLDEQGEPEFHFTKRVIRRYPHREGPAVYHVVDWVPDAARAGLQFLQAAGVRGLGMLEFKLDVRDGQLKFIESNLRFTAANNLLEAAGIDLGLYVYDRVTTGHSSEVTTVAEGLHLWHPVLDLRAMIELRARGEITPAEWLRSVAHRQVLPYFAAGDLGPSVAKAKRELSLRVRRGRGAAR
jgi:D-aspartate ligase